ncbi:hypothetical protein [Nocardia sp. CC201C]|uniref:hypothetical protein n=1 Tax=Nocardia sp. CC201C TaxID=3044575 RepID=UPI0024A976D1|nr:hypothetical protein [Nocardia sp. CC201C]
MMETLLDDLAMMNRPDQFGLLERATDVFAASPAVTRLLVRGSLAAGTADRLSDVDFVIGVEDRWYGDFVTALDDLMACEMAAILPGWRDIIVANMGGLGYVYLVVHNGTLRQLDLYVTPVSRLDSVHTGTRAQPLYIRTSAVPPTATSASTASAAADFIARTATAPRSCADLLVELLVLGCLIQKRITRGQTFIAYDESHLFATAAKDFVKAALAPGTRYYGWYHLQHEVGATPLGRRCLAMLDALIHSPSVPSHDTLTANLDRVLAIADQIAPEVLTALGPAIDAYRYYLELS